jgi:LAS superfamily LD-carboxypeptidase LdcB
LRAQAGEERVLLISHPQLWSAPSEKASAKGQSWKAGRRLTVLGREGKEEKVSQAFTDLWFKVEAEGKTGWLPDAYLTILPAQIDPRKLDQIGEELVDRYHSLPPEYAPADLEPVGPRQDPEVNYRLRREAATALHAMFAAAKADGIKLLVVSAYRSWEKQQELYERRVRQSGLAQGSVAKPGHSEHQLGTAVDLTDGSKEHLLEESFGDTPAGRWLREHAWTYGFAVSFTRHNQPQTGCIPEPWHYRYWGIGQARMRHFEALGEKGAQE